jgi:hypothetical protein
MDPAILDLTGRAILFPVRHHSPACARALRALARQLRPSTILIEGPSDFNDQLEELFLPHELPVAIYSYHRLEDGARRGAFYPFCVYSPEWQALQAARALGAVARFIDLPWAAVAEEGLPSHRYADGELRRSEYIPTLCRRLGVEDFDTLWDTLVEIDPQLTPAQYLERCHTFCYHARRADEHVPDTDLRREAFMADQVRRALAERPGQVLVVTGGFHSYALFELVNGGADCRLQIADCGLGEAGPNNPQSAIRNPQSPAEQGIALTPYSYERLDSLTGYEAGMPNPGFYHQVWEDRERAPGATARRLLAHVARDLRERKQAVSAADLIAVETTARALAALRSHAEVWRGDLIDGILGALVKDELDYGGAHPFLQAVYEAFRGRARGRLAEGTSVPLLVQDLRRELRAHDLEPALAEREIDLELVVPEALARSRVLHRLRVLEIAGFDRTGGSDLVRRQDLTRLWERWRIRWSPDFEARAIEAAIYGPTLLDAAGARLQERAAAGERTAEQAALALLDACLMGLDRLAGEFTARLIELVRADPDFFTLSRATGRLLYLYAYDEVLGAAGGTETGALLAETFTRGLWLLEGLGQVQGMERELVDGVATLLQTFERAGARLGLDREELVAVLRRTSAESGPSALLRGASTGALWTLGEADTATVQAGMRFCAQPDQLGDYLTGLFSLARETVQRHPELVASIDDLLMGYNDAAFLEALPALRLAFSYFTPREKHYMARTLLEARGMTAEPLADLEVSAATAAAALALEARLFAAVGRYGLRGGER